MLIFLQRTTLHLNDSILSAGPCRAVIQPCSKRMNDPSKNSTAHLIINWLISS